MRESLAYVKRNWNKQGIYADLRDIEPSALDAAERNVESTYFIRLYAEFEGILKEHLARNHRFAAFPQKPRVDELIQRVTKANSMQIDRQLRARMNDVRDYRNALAHRPLILFPPVTFTQALSILNRFLDKLPEPYKP